MGSRDWLSTVIIGAAVVLGLAVLVGAATLVLDFGGDEAPPANAGAFGDCENANLDPETGTAAGLACDGRPGAPVPPIELGDPARAAKAAGCRLRTDLPSEGTRHVPANIPLVYRTDPPTSGPMYDATIADGAYLSTPPAPHVVHSLEHGRIAIQYHPSLSEEAQLELKAVNDEQTEQVILFPNRAINGTVAVTAWTTLLDCPRYNRFVVDAVRSFRDVYRDQGPETSTGLPR